MSRKILLLHPEETLPSSGPAGRWDLVVDLGRAPLATYERWHRQVDCEVFSLHRFGREIGDLDHLRELLQFGIGRMVDRSGIDWWGLLCLFIANDLQQLMLVHRLSRELGAGCELFSSRPHPLAAALQGRLGVRLTILENRFQSMVRRARHFQRAFSHLDTAQLAQVLEDKFPAGHAIRSRFARPGHSTKRPVILLPSAYVNVSRTALSYAKMLPDHRFLLVLARSSGKLRSLPQNVSLASLSSYFVATSKQEIDSLLVSWESLRRQLLGEAEEFDTADAVGALGKVPALLPWGIAMRDAWSRVFESENIVACLSADDSNPTSSIPIAMAKNRGLPALACHHGALDYHMAIKMNLADFYLAKSEMEQDYLRRICHLAPEKIVLVAPPSSRLLSQSMARRSAPWLVFFTEPYESYGWRNDEVYRDLLPRLRSLTQACGMKLVFKLHPFESVKGHRKMLRRLVPEQERDIDVIAGPPSDKLWNNTRCALTVQSSTALECSALGIPVFLFSWLQHSYSGYVQQYQRFGAGQVLESAEQIDEIPARLEQQTFQPHAFPRATGASKLADLFSGAYPLAAASGA